MKRLLWAGSSYDDFKEFPEPVHKAIARALQEVRLGAIPHRGKVLSGLGSAKVQEIRENDASGTYRAVYTVEFKGIVFVLHAFQKKSKKGIATPRKDIDLIMRRLKGVRDFVAEGAGKS